MASRRRSRLAVATPVALARRSAAALGLSAALCLGWPSGGVVEAQGRYEGSTEARRIFEEGQRLEQKAVDLKAARPKDSIALYKDALERYEATIKVDPEFIEGYVRLAYVHYALGNGRAAVGSLDPALERWPDDPTIHRAYGAVLFDLPGRRDEAVGHLEAAAEADEEQFDVFFLLGKHYYERKTYDKAARAFRQYLRLKPEDVQIHGTLGNIYLKTEKYEPALAEFRLVLSLDEDNLAAQINIGNIRFKQRRYDLAVEQFEKVLAQDAEQKNVHFNLASSLFQLKRFDKSLVHYRAFLDHRPRHPTSHYMVGRCLLSLDKDGEAREAFEATIRAQASFARAWWHLGLLDMKVGKVAEARSRLEVGLGHAPEDPFSLSSLGDALRRLGLPHEAIVRHEAAIALDSKVVDFHLGLGRSRFAMRQLDEAAAAFEAALALEPGSERARGPLAVALLHRARGFVRDDAMEKAERDAGRLLEIGARAAEAHLILTAVAIQRGDLVGARRSLELAAEAAKAPCDVDCPAPWVQRARGRLALAQGDHRGAIEALTPLLKGGRAPDVGVANDLGQASAGLERWPEALEWFVMARDLGLEPARAERNIALACIQVAQQLGEAGQWREAVSVLDTAEGYRARLGEAEKVALDLSRSHALAEVNNFAKAQSLLDAAARALPRLSSEDRARLPEEGALALGLRQAYIQLRLGRVDRALALAERLPRGESVNALLAAAWTAQAVEHFEKGRLGPARVSLRDAAGVARQDEVIEHNLTVLDYAQGNKGKSGEVFKKASESGVAEALFNYAVYLDDVKGDDRGAFDLYKRVAERGGPRADEARRIAGAKGRVFGYE